MYNLVRYKTQPLYWESADVEGKKYLIWLSRATAVECSIIRGQGYTACTVRTQLRNASLENIISPVVFCRSTTTRENQTPDRGGQKLCHRQLKSPHPEQRRRNPVLCKQ